MNYFTTAHNGTTQTNDRNPNGNTYHNYNSDNQRTNLQWTEASVISFEFGINCKLYNKHRKGNDTLYWETQKGTVSDLAANIVYGHGFMTGILNGKRADKNVVAFSAIALDIDEGLSLEEAQQHPFISKYAGLIYTSSSHQKAKQKQGTEETIQPCDRYRVVFVLPETITDLSLWSYLYQIVCEQIPQADPSCKNIGRYFYGNTEAEIPIEDETKFLPRWIIDEAETLRDMAKAQKNHAPKPKPKSIQNYDTESTRKLVEQALEFIPQRSPGSNNYHECLRVLMALFSEFGEDAIAIAENWSPSIPSTTWNVPDKIRSIQRSERNGITIGTLFYIAKQYGFEMPKKATGKGFGSTTFKSNPKEDNSNFYESQLTIEQAVEEARSLLKQGMDEISQNIALESLRLRCGAGSGFWNNDIIKPLKRETHKDRFRLELKRIKKIDDRVEREYELSKIAPQFQMSIATLKQALNYLDIDEKTPKAFSMSLDELLDMESEGIDFLIPGWIPKGETIILGGEPKSGKTLLSTDLAFAVATGESKFLGETPVKGKVLIIQSDQSPKSSQSQILKRGFRKQDKANFDLLLNWDISQMSVLEQKLEDFRPDLVIVDSLRRINHGAEISENSAEFADNIYTLKEMFGRYGAAGILIHHTNKDHEAIGVGKLRGSSAIAGAVWGIMNLQQIPQKNEETGKWEIHPDDPRRTLDFHARDIEGQSVNIKLNLEDYSWALDLTEKQKQADIETSKLRDRILDVLNKNPNGLSGSEIVELLDNGETSKGSVYSTLNRMVTKKIISSRPAKGNHRYTIYSIIGLKNDKANAENSESTNNENISPPPPPTPSEVNVISEAEALVNNDFQTSNTSNSHITHKNTLEQSVIPENPNSEDNLEAHITSNTIKGGGGETQPKENEQTDTVFDMEEKKEYIEQPIDETIPVKIGDTVSYQHFSGKILKSTVKEIHEQTAKLSPQSNYIKLVQFIKLEDGSTLFSDSNSLVELIDQWGKQKSKKTD